MLEHNSTVSLSISVTFRFLCHLFGKMVPQKLISVLIELATRNGPNMRKPGLKIETKAGLKLSDIFFEKPDAFNWFLFDILSNCGFILGDGGAGSRRG